MFCQKCGKKIPDNAIFCRYCGTKQESIIEQHSEKLENHPIEVHTQENSQDSPAISDKILSLDNESEPLYHHPNKNTKTTLPPSSSKSGAFLTFFLIMFAILTIGFAVYHIDNNSSKKGSSSNRYNGSGNSSSSYTPQLFSRSATNADVIIDEEYDSLISIKIKIRPYCDIKGLELTINHYSKNGTLIESQKKQLGNVLEGNEYTTSVSLLDFSFEDILDISKSSIGVTGGTVSYFQ